MPAPKIKIVIPRGLEPTLAKTQRAVDQMLAPPSTRRTFATSILTDNEAEDGWYKCQEVGCRDLTRAGYANGVPHIHKDK